MTSTTQKIVTFVLIAGVPICSRATAIHPSTSMSAPAGFEVTLFADDDLAHDIFSLTTNPRGDVVVSGPGYVRVLLDRNGDGQADAFETFAHSPATGAQGMSFDGPDLLCTGDGGLLRYRDQDGDDVADGPPQQLLALKTGGEHFAHAVQQGPDGWWYVLLGNLAGIDRGDVTLESSPVRDPEAGVLMRIAPDFTDREVIADGFRNPYDFAFHPHGAVFTFDSDGERDVSLPWYRPTRVFQIMPGTHAGWVTPSWKQPDYYPDMPATTVSCGRGSPTGVVVYRHYQFPRRYRNALFILDWTFGRVLAVQLAADGSRLAGSVETFLSAKGQFGFAPTDAAVTPEGDLMISVGGRGTRGGVYRVRYTGSGEDTSSWHEEDSSDLTHCLTAPQPLASWSRARWIPQARLLGRERLIEAAEDRSRSAQQRVRAVEILCQLHGGLDASSLESLAGASSAPLRARVAWAVGRQAWNRAELDTIYRLLGDGDPRVVRSALDAVSRNASCSCIPLLLPRIAQHLEAVDRYVWQSAWKVVSRLSTEQQQRISAQISSASHRARIGYALAITDRRPTRNEEAFNLAWEALFETPDPQLKVFAVRALQKALGDLQTRDDLPDVYDGYCPAPQHDAVMDCDVHALAALLPSGHGDLDIELARLIAMLGPDSSVAAAKLADMLNESSHPVDDAHYLIALSRLPVPWTDALRQCVADALVALETKLHDYRLQQDRNWDLRIAEMYQQLLRRDPQLAATLIDHPRFGLPGHVIFARDISVDLRERAATRMAGYLEQAAEGAWTNDVIFLLGQSARPEHRQLVREQFEDMSLRGAVIQALAKRPTEPDRRKFITGLRSADLSVVQASAQALEQLQPGEEPEELFEMLGVIRRLGADRHERVVRDRLVELLRRATGQQFGYRLGLRTNDPQIQAISDWTEYLKERYPNMARERLQSSEAQLAELLSRLESVDWSGGRPRQGERLFQLQSCRSCHNARAAVGPDLAGIGARFSRNDLFTAIVYPNQDVSPRYNTTMIETTRGRVLSGMVIYESVDGVTLLDSTNQTIRVESDEIDFRYELSTSLMPAGLIDNLAPQELADLYAYLKSL